MKSDHQHLEALEEKNRALEDKLSLCQRAFDTLTDMIFLKDEASRHILVNRSLLKFCGKSEQEVIGHTAYEFLPAEVAAVCQASDEKAIATGQAVITEETLGERDYEMFKFPVAMSGNRTGIGGFIRDITERKRSEEALKESENRYRELAEMLPQVVFELDLGGYFTFGNRYGLELFGYSEEELRRINVFQLIVPEDRQRAWISFRKVLNGESREGNEYTALKRNGSTFPFMIFSVPVFRGQQQVGIRGILIDMTERKRAEKKLKDLSHRDPLTGLYNRAYFQEELDRLAAGRRFPVSIVMADVDRLKQVNDREGHQAGDDLLRRAAEVLGTFRSEDVVARIGGDEFAVILAGTDEKTAKAVLERVRESLADHNGRHPEKPLGLSFGAATGGKGCSLDELLRQADEQMYLCKPDKDRV